MSEVVTVSAGVTGTIYGTFAAAVSYVAARFGESYTSWSGLTDADKKRTLISAADYLNSFAWNEDYDTFAERDAHATFVNASYEAGVLIASGDLDVNVVDQGSNIERIYADGAGIDFANPTSAARGTAPVLPPILMRLIGGYLASAGAASASAGYQSGSTRNPFDDCSDFDRKDSW